MRIWEILVSGIENDPGFITPWLPDCPGGNGAIEGARDEYVI